jgi:hypothetical protein
MGRIVAELVHGAEDVLTLYSQYLDAVKASSPTDVQRARIAPQL